MRASALGARAWSLVTAAAVAVAVGSSVWQLGRRPLWIDEAISLGATRQLTATWRATGGTMGLYYLVLTGWTTVVGDSPVALRSLSVALVAAVVVVSAALLRRLLPVPIAAAALLMTAASPGLVRMGQDARGYALVTLLVVASWWCLDHALEGALDAERRSDTQRWRLALILLAVAGALTQGLFVLHVAALAVSVAASPARRCGLRAVAPALLAAAATTAGLLAMGAGSVGDWIPPLSWAQAASAGRTLGGPVGWVSLLLAALAAVGAAVSIRGRSSADDDLARWRSLVPLWWSVVPLSLLAALSTVRPAFLGRYVLASTPGLAALVALGGAAVISAIRKADPTPRTTPTRAATAALAIVVMAGLTVTRIERAELPHEDWDAVVAHIAAEARPGDALIFPHATDQTHADTVRAPFEAAWSRLDDPAVVPQAISPDRPLGEVRRLDDPLPPDELARRVVEHPRAWAVEFTAFHPSLRDAMSREPAASRYRTVERHTFPGGMVVLLMVRDDA